jgi:hypothetical protein
MADKIYCIYTDQHLPPTACNYEHIVPLSLGGNNHFGLNVSSAYNSAAGSRIDGAMANDPFIGLIRSRIDSRGHSRKAVQPVWRKCRKNDGTPVQLRFRKEFIEAWDPLTRSTVEECSAPYKINLKIGRFDRLRFAAKVALSGGYFVYGTQFVNAVDHSQLRMLMNSTDQSIASIQSDFGLRVHDPFITPETSEANEYFSFIRAVISELDCSCVVFIPTDSTLMVSVGILGKYVATVNVQAITKDLPATREHLHGHFVLLKNRRLYRQAAYDVYLALLRRMELNGLNKRPEDKGA